MMGVYQIKNKINGHCYIGSTNNIRIRFINHRSSLNHNRHHSIYLQRAWNKYGADAFEFIMLYCIEREEDLIPLEQQYYDIFLPVYNMAKFASKPMRGRKQTEEAKKKIGIASRNRVFTAEASRNMSLAKRGENHPQSKLSRERIVFAKFLRSAWGLTYREISEYYGVTIPTIYNALSGRSWKHLG